MSAGGELAAEYRRRADELDRRAAESRGDGDSEHAAELEQVAVDYWQAALDLELETAGAL